MSQYRTIAYCKNHPQQMAGYFLSEQPWHKLCSTCALNTALCGKKIQKQLSTVQFQRKMQLNSLSHQFKGFINQYSQENDNIVKFLQQIEENYTKHVNQNLKIIDQYTRSIVQAKQELFDLFDKEIKRKTNIYFQKQSKSILVSLQIKKQMEYIQSNFGNLIQAKDEQMFQAKVKGWRQMLDNAKVEAITKKQMIEYEQKMKQITSLFHQGFQLFSESALKFSKTKIKLLNSSEETNNISLSEKTKNSQKNALYQNNQPKQKQEIIKNTSKKQPKTQLKLRAKSRAVDNQNTCRKSQYDDSRALTKRSSKAKIQTKGLSKSITCNN